MGHGPSAEGSWPDDFVVRLKGAPKELGTQIDALCANRTEWFDKVEGDYQRWLFPLHCPPDPDSFNADLDRWMAYYESFSPKCVKPSHGLMALFCAQEMGFQEVFVTGFDWFFGGESRKWCRAQSTCPHDIEAEIKAMKGLELKVTNIGSIH